jgi:hypothetical protein
MAIGYTFGIFSGLLLYANNPHSFNYNPNSGNILFAPEVLAFQEIETVGFIFGGLGTGSFITSIHLNYKARKLTRSAIEKYNLNLN